MTHGTAGVQPEGTSKGLIKEPFQIVGEFLWQINPNLNSV